MNFRVTPVDGATVPSSAAPVSSVRTLVVPTATPRPPPPRAALISAAASGGNRYGSGWISYASTSSGRIGEKVPYPTERVTRATPTPPPDRSPSHRPSSSLRSRRTLRTLPNSNSSPSFSRFEGRASASQRSSPAAPVSGRGDRRKTSTDPPVAAPAHSRP